MALATRNPTVNTTPDPGQGGSAVTGNINTGHASTSCTASRSVTGITTQTKTCLWHTFSPGVSGQTTAINLKFTYNASGTTFASTSNSGETVISAIALLVDYSLNSGSNWTNAVSPGVQSISTDGGGDDNDNLSTGSVNATVSIPISTPLANIRVRDSIIASVDVTEVTVSSGTADITASISDIRLEITLADGGLLVMGM